MLLMTKNGMVEVPLETLWRARHRNGGVQLPRRCLAWTSRTIPSCPAKSWTRPCLEQVLSNGPANTTVTYQKSFVTNTGAIKNLYLFSNGQLYWEDPIGAPGSRESALHRASGELCEVGHDVWAGVYRAQ